MTDEGQNVYYLAPAGIKEEVVLAFPSEIEETAGYEVTNGFGIFVFPRCDKNRGKPRSISFPVVQGFGEAAQEFVVTLTTDYSRTKNSHRLVCAPDDNRPFLEKVSFLARKLPARIRIAGEASRLKSFNLWGLIPENREILEELWRTNQFYFLGYGHIPNNGSE